MGLADKYDAAQERGEVHTRSNHQLIPEQNKVAADEIGLTAKQVHEARQIRDAEIAHPGIVRETLDAQLAAREEQTKAAVPEAVAAPTRAVRRQAPAATGDSSAFHAIKDTAG